MKTMVTKERDQLWRKRLQEWRASGLSAAGFARREGFSASSLRYWEVRVGLGKAEPVQTAVGVGAPTMVRVVRRGEMAETQAGEAPIVVEVGGARILVHPGFDTTLLSSVVRVLGELGL